MARRAASLVAVCLLVLLFGSTAVHAAVQPLFVLDHPSSAPFPSDRFTVPDSTQLTDLRVNLPKPDCAVFVSDCEDVTILNTLDGFNVQPRLSIPFSGPIDVHSVTSDSVFLIGPGARRVGINQVVWDVATTTLHVESDELLEQHTPYVLVVTRDVRDAAGMPVEPAEAFVRFRHDLNFGQTKDEELKRYRKALLDGLARLDDAGVRRSDVAVASVFTTQSVTAILEKIRDQIKGAMPAPADFRLGPGGTRTVFALSDIVSITNRQQTSTAPGFTTVVLPRLPLVRIIPGAVGRIAFGKFLAPHYLSSKAWLPPIGTRSGVPSVQSTEELFFNLFLPSGPTPARGWPVAIYGHGGAEDKNGTPFNVAAVMAAHGIATIAITEMGRGFGPLSTLTVALAGANQVTFPAGGRSVDRNGDGTIGATEGAVPAAPPSDPVGRDCVKQTTAGLMQLIRVIEGGMDVDGDGLADLDASRIYATGLSNGGGQATVLTALDRSVRAAVLNVPGGLGGHNLWLAPGGRQNLGRHLASRVPSLINVADPSGIVFDDNLPLRNQPPVVNSVSGAVEIQTVLENLQWLFNSAITGAFAPYLRKSPLDGLPVRPVIVQFPKGDMTQPNPGVTATLRAGDLADRATYFRNDLLFAADPLVPTDPHNFLVTIGAQARPSRLAAALAAQQQIAVFFASDGAIVIDPDSPAPLFETPIAGPLPEELNFLP